MRSASFGPPFFLAVALAALFWAGCKDSRRPPRPQVAQPVIADGQLDRLRAADAALVAGDVDKAIQILQECMLASAFSPSVVAGLAYAHELKGEFDVANWVRWGDELTWVPAPWFAAPVTAAALQPAPLEKHIAGASKYFQRRGGKVSPLVAVMFEYIGRKFGLGWSKPIVDSFYSRINDSEYFPVLRKLLEPNDDRVPAFGNDEPINRDILPALYCNSRPLPKGYFAQLFWSSYRGGYELTHAAGAIEWAYEQGCIEASEQWRALRQYQVAQMWQLAETEPEVTDLFVESITMLYYVGAQEVVRPEWIDRIARAQLADGGWAPPSQTDTVDHISMLAYWALLEAAYPETPKVGMTIR